MITFKSMKEIELMHEAGKILASCHKEIAKMIRPGVCSVQIDKFVYVYLAKWGATPAQKGYNGYRHAICASVNDEICHGFPNHKPFINGDIVTIDMVVDFKGGLADSAWSYAVGTISAESQRLLNVAKESLYKGIEKVQAGNRVGDIGHAIQTYVETEGFSVVRDFAGHGIGRRIHEEPTILHYGKPGSGVKLREGMVLTVEPMVNEGSWHCIMDTNGWTARTADGKRSAQYEHTIAITPDGPLILTEQNW